MMKVLVISSEADQRRWLAERLAVAGCACHCIAETHEPLVSLHATYDVVLCDRGLHPSEPFELGEAGQAGTPTGPRVVVVGIRHAEHHRPPDIKLGRLLHALARVFDAAQDDKQPISCLDLHIEPAELRASRCGVNLHLTPTEFRVLECLARHAGDVVSRRVLCDTIWSKEWYGVTNVVDVYVSRVRRKVDSNFAHRLIHTVRGVGYRLGQP